MLAAGASDADDKPEKCGLLMWICDRNGEPLGPTAMWPARKGLRPMWNSARHLLQTFPPQPDCGPPQVRIELWGTLDDGSHAVVAGPVHLAPSKLPMKDAFVPLARAGSNTSSSAFNPAPPCQLLLRALPSIPRNLQRHAQRKTLFFIRHGESKWNAAKKAHNVYKMAREHDHPLNEAGYRQAFALQAAIRAALAQPASDGSEPTTAQSIGLAGAFWASPLTRAVQTAITALQPILTQPGVTLELKLNAREKKNFGGLDSIGRVCGNQCLERGEEGRFLFPVPLIRTPGLSLVPCPFPDSPRSVRRFPPQL